MICPSSGKANANRKGAGSSAQRDSRLRRRNHDDGWSKYKIGGLAGLDVQALLESLVYDYTDSGLKVSLCGRTDCPVVTAPHALRRIIINLTDNGLKFGDNVEISVERDVSDGVSIVVRDRGPGIPEAELEAVLRPFYRVESSRSRETGGAGLGLAIASQLATALGGELRLANRDGGGLAAHLTLPRGSNVRRTS